MLLGHRRDRDLWTLPGGRVEPGELPTEAVLRDRIENDAARYQKWYGVDFLDMAHYDLILDSTVMPASEITQKIVDFAQSHTQAPTS